MSEIKVNKISPITNCGTTTLGDRRDTFTIPAGVSITTNGTASGFGATGSASWNTTVKTSGFTAVAGEGYFVDTTSGPISINLPAGTAGAVVAFKDYAGTFDSNPVTLVQNGSDKIGGSAVNGTLSSEGIAVTFVFVDSTKGWLVTDDGFQSRADTSAFVVATGGSVTTSGDYKIHTFTGPGTFCVSSGGAPCGSNTVDYLVIAGGGSGGGRYGGGGGAGGYRESPGTASGSYSVSPLGAAPAVALPVPAQAYPITVGAGGAQSAPDPNPGGSNQPGNKGNNSVFSTITSTAGGSGASQGYEGPGPAYNGGSGGGAGHTGPAGVGNTPPVSPAQGTNGGTGVGASNYMAGGGGGATVAGTNAPPGGGGNGGNGATSSINGTPTTRAGGGGGGGSTYNSPGNGGSGGTGGGQPGGSSAGSRASAGTANTGGGGGGGFGAPGMGGAGGSGIVIIRYKFQ